MYHFLTVRILQLLQVTRTNGLIGQCIYYSTRNNRVRPAKDLNDDLLGILMLEWSDKMLCMLVHLSAAHMRGLPEYTCNSGDATLQRRGGW